ncbi:MAG: hypothetical protein JWR26_2886 [Pedosphaera sp.]|nr:hypothetical protein [Pedosphaera sp.]
MNRLLAPCLGLVLLSLAATGLWAGGSGLNVLIVVNQNSTNSVQLGNYYREQRQVPPQNFLRINWPGINTEWSLTDFTNTLLNPLMTTLASRQLTNQIDYVVLSMDIPYRVNGGVNGENSTASALFYGFIPDTRDLNTCPMANGSTNLYAASESIFRQTPPLSGLSNSFLVTMITGTNLALAKQVVDQGVLSDGTFPTQTVILAKSTDIARNVRYQVFDNAVFNLQLHGNSVQRTNGSIPPSTNLLGFQTGVYAYSAQPNTFVPGAMADNLTSFGGQLFEYTSGQTTLLAFLEAGAAGSFGTVIEPCNYPDKFPDAQNYFYQARGFSLAECYYQSVTNPYQGQVVGEPLAAPFAMPANGSWVGLGSNAVLSATTNLDLQFTASSTQRPVQQVDLFLDGQWLQTLTNIPPRLTNVVKVTVNGTLVSLPVPANATIKSTAAALTTSLNSKTSTTKVQAFAHGDRIELQSTDTTKTGAQLSLSVSSSTSSGTLNTFLSCSRANFLDSTAWGIKTFDVSGTQDINSALQVVVTKTNGAIVTVALTNIVNAGLTQFAQNFLDLINNTPSLQGNDGLAGEDLLSGSGIVEFHFRARGQGYAAAQIQGSLTSTLTVNQYPGNTINDNLSDLVPRNHIFVTAGATNLGFSFPLNTTTLADGYHELAAVSYEGSHVRTQTRATQNVRIQNTTLSATFTNLVGGTNTALEAMLQFQVTANTNTISKIELFSTGGSLGVVSNLSTATFSIAATNLGIGLHPFYAVVTANSGKQYRTDTKYFRLVGMDSPFTVQLSAPPPTIGWPAAAGRHYDVLSSTTAAGPFQLRATVIPTNSLAHWTETNASPAEQIYRVRVSP